MGNKKTIAVRIDPETKRDIEDRLEYGDSMSEWFRGAADQRLTIDAAADDHPEELSNGWWREALLQYLNKRDEGEPDEGNPTQATAAD